MEQKMIKCYRFRGAGAGEESITELPLNTWENWTKRRANGSWVFPDAQNWRLLNGKLEVESEKEVYLTSKDIKNIERTSGDDQKKKEFNAAITLAEEHFSKGEFNEALEKYKEASEILPRENYPKAQIKKINLELKK